MTVALRNRDADGLSPQHARFVREYLKDLNGRAAYERSGYKARGAVADAAAARLLAHVRVRAAIKRVLGEQTKRYDISADKVLQESARLAFFDARQLYNEDGSLKPVSAWPDEVAAAVSGIESIERTTPEGLPAGITKKVHLWSKPSQLLLLAKHLRLLHEDKTPSTVINVTVAVQSLSGALTRAYSDSGRAESPKLP